MELGTYLSLKDILQQTDPNVQLIKSFYFNYLSKPHPNLGRSGAVCPFVPLALKFDKIYTILAPKANSKQVETILLEKALFMESQSKDSAFVIFVPSLTPPEVDKLQIMLKPLFVSKGLMIGEFHPLNSTPGIHNPAFFPLRSQIPCLAIRHMVKEDFPFMTKSSYSFFQTILFLLCYYRKFPKEIMHLQVLLISAMILLIVLITFVVKFWR